MPSRPILALAALLLTTAAIAKPQFIEQSRIIYPRQAGELKLVATSFNKQAIAEGVGLQYELTSKPGVRIDVYVYPAGRMPEADAMEAGVADLRASIDYAGKHGAYENVHMKGERKLDLKVGEDTTLHGRMLSFDFTKEALRYESRALLFYRFDYYLKVRTSTDAFEAGELDQALVQVAADLVPEIRVRNRGDCKPSPSIGDQIAEAQANNSNERQRKSNSVFLTDRVPPDQLIAMLEAERRRQVESGCVDNFGDDDAKPRRGEEYTMIRFPKGAWD